MKHTLICVYLLQRAVPLFFTIFHPIEKRARNYSSFHTQINLMAGFITQISYVY